MTSLTIFYAGLVYTALLMTLSMWLKRLGLIGPKKRLGESDEVFKSRLRQAG